jgi:chromosomal replication initiation ATPase DnaA
MRDKQFQKLLKNISTALQYKTIEELNSYISYVAKDNKKIEAQKKILEFVCKEYDIRLSTLIKTKSNQDIVRAKRVCFCVLHNVLGFPSRYIAFNIFKMTYHNMVADAIKRYKKANIKIKEDRDYKEEVDNITLKAIQIINN